MLYKHYDEEEQLIIWDIDYTPGYFTPEKKSGHPDNWQESAECETEILSVLDPKGNEIIWSLDNKILDKIIKKVDQHLEDLADNY